MNASNLARGTRRGASLAARGLDQAAETLEARATILRAEAGRIRKTPRNAVGDEQGKASMLLGVQALTEAADAITANAERLAASANTPEVGVSSRMLASALGVSTNTAIKRIRQATGERGAK